MINKISKLSKSFHLPMKMPMSTEFLTPKYINSPSEFAEAKHWLMRNVRFIALYNSKTNP